MPEGYLNLKICLKGKILDSLSFLVVSLLLLVLDADPTGSTDPNSFPSIPRIAFPFYAWGLFLFFVSTQRKTAALPIPGLALLIRKTAAIALTPACFAVHCRTSFFSSLRAVLEFSLVTCLTALLS